MSIRYSYIAQFLTGKFYTLLTDSAMGVDYFFLARPCHANKMGLAT